MTELAVRPQVLRNLFLAVTACLILVLSGCSAHRPAGPGYAHRPAPVEADTSEPVQLSAQERAVLEARDGSLVDFVPAANKSRVEREYSKYLHSRRGSMKTFSKRAEKYLAYTRNVFRRKGMPEELAYLAIVESGYNSGVTSKANAAGAWQFMSFTGMKYGLNQDGWIDERRDIYKATEAAANYLSFLYSRFGDWPTAIASYNAGEGKMSNALAAADARNYYELCTKNNKIDEKLRLRKETLDYVPRFMAITKIMNHLGQLGFSDIHPESAPVMARVAIPPSTNLQAMSKACNVPWTSFHESNLHHKKAVSSPYYGTNVYVPSQMQAVATTYARAPKIVMGNQLALAGKTPQAVVRPATGKSYRLGQGETVYSVARKTGTSVDSILAMNGLKSASQVRPGQSLRLPESRTKAGAPSYASAEGKGGKSGRTAGPAAPVSVSNSKYQVQANDNLWRISRKFNVSVDDLKRWNNINEGNLKIGQSLIVCK